MTKTRGWAFDDPLIKEYFILDFQKLNSYICITSAITKLTFQMFLLFQINFSSPQNFRKVLTNAYFRMVSRPLPPPRLGLEFGLGFALELGLGGNFPLEQLS